MNIDKLQLTGDRYLIKPHEAAKKSASGLTMENNSNVAAAPVLGTILRAGAKAEYAVGDQILFRRYSIDELKFVTKDGEQTVFIVEGDEIVAVIKKEDVDLLQTEEEKEKNSLSIMNEGEVVKLE